jgi:hypothetical protein
MRTIRLQIAATETHCETEDDQCVHLRGISCAVFNLPIWDNHTENYRRLPECIAAEEAGK